MEKETLQSNLLSVLTGRYPDKAELVKKLMEILSLEREPVYRRLRGSASFTFAEIAIISETFGISLDNLIGVDVSRARPFSLVLTNFESPTEKDYEMCESFLRLLNVMKDDPSTICTETWNSLPVPMIYMYPAISQFYFLKWAYQFQNYIPAKKFNELIVPERYMELQRENFEKMKQLANTEFILSPRIIEDLVCDIHYYYRLGLLEKVNIRQIYDDVTLLLNDLEVMTLTGQNMDTGTKFSLYISHVSIDLNQCYMESDIYNFCMIRVLVLNGISSIDGTKNENVKNWLTAQKRLSTLISVSGEKDRIQFFRHQREQVEKLLAIE